MTVCRETSRKARRHLKDSCEACGSFLKLQAHHVDQKRANNRPSNIQTLCKSCHDFWHNTQRRLGLAVAGKMPALNVGRIPARRKSA